MSLDLFQKKAWLFIGAALAPVMALSLSIYALIFERGILTPSLGVCLSPKINRICFSVAHTLSTQQTTALATSPDGKLLASSQEKKILVWNLVTGKQLATLVGHTGWVSAISFSPDSKTIASSSLDRTVRLWNLNTGKFSSFNAGRMTTLAFSPDGQILAGGSRNSLWFDSQPGISGVQLWELKTRNRLPALGSDRVGSLAFSPDGQLIAAGGTITQLWNLKTRQLLRNLDSGRVTTLAFSPNRQTLVTGSSKIKFWDVNTGNLIYLLKSGSSDLALSADGEALAIASGGMVEVWQVNGKILGELRGSRYGNMHIAFGANGKSMIVGGSEGLKIWRAR